MRIKKIGGDMGGGFTICGDGCGEKFTGGDGSGGGRAMSGEASGG